MERKYQEIRTSEATRAAGTDGHQHDTNRVMGHGNGIIGTRVYGHDRNGTVK